MAKKKKDEERMLIMQMDEKLNLEKRLRLRAKQQISKIIEAKFKEKNDDGKIANIYDSKHYRAVFDKYRQELGIIFRFYIEIKDDKMDQPNFLEHMQYRVLFINMFDKIIMIIYSFYYFV